MRLAAAQPESDMRSEITPISSAVASRSFIDRLVLALAIALAGLMLTGWLGRSTPASILVSAGSRATDDGTCFATADDGLTVFSSTTASAVQAAIGVANPGDIVKAAGYCAGVFEIVHAFQTVHIAVPLTLRGGYTTTNWSLSFPLTQPTTLDAQGLGRVIVAIDDLALYDLIVQNGYEAGVGGCPSGCGGGILASGALSLVNVTILSSTATAEGGGAYVFGAAQFSDSLFQHNHCTAVGCYGGGASVYSALTLTGTRFVSNTAAGAGGGLYLTAGLGGTNRLVNGLFARNTATTAAAMYLIDPVLGVGSAEVLHATIVSPTVGNQSAIEVGGGSVNLTNTLIASYTIGLSNSGGTLTEDYNLFFGTLVTTTGEVTPGLHTRAGDPEFGDAAADDYHLGLTSSALDRGVKAGVDIDLDGSRRPQGLGYDIGAYEAPGYVDLVIAKSVSAAHIKPGQAITYSLHFSNTGTVTATQVLITESIPVAYLVNLGYAATQPITLSGISPAVWQTADLAPGDGGQITITGIVSPGLQGLSGFINTARIGSAEDDVELTNNVSSATVLARYDLVVASVGSGTINLEPLQADYGYGAAVTLTAIPATDWLFAGWSGDLASLDNPATLIIERNSQITATFAAGCDPLAGVAMLYAPSMPRPGQPVLFTAVITAGTLPITYTWDFGHAEAVVTRTTSVVHSFPLTDTAYSYTVTLTADNDCSRTTADPRLIDVWPWRVYLPVIVRE